MPISNQKGLDALKALTEGGSAGLDSYRQAQAAEAQSRTGALQKALGGQDLGAAVAKAQAQYAPKLDTSAPNVGNLQAAANNYLSRAANKLSAQNYEDQQRLTLQGARLAQQESALSEKERLQQLQGAADIMAQKQIGDAQANVGLVDQQANLAARKAALRQQLTEFDAGNQAAIGTAAMAQAGGQEAQGQEYLAQRQAQRQAILDQMGALDEQQAASAQQLAQFLGTDTKGLQEAYARADQGDVQAARDLATFLNPRAQTAAAEAERGIAVGGQERLRQLAPAFGIDELTAAGMFREGEGSDLQRQKQLDAEGNYVAGNVPQKQRDEAVAADLGFDSTADYRGLRTKSRMSDAEITDALQSEAWSGIQGIYEDAVKGTIEGGAAGFQAGVRNYVNSLQKPEGVDDAQWKTRTAKLIQLANAYYKDPTKAAAGSDESAVE